MNIVDIIILAVIFLSAIIGFGRGLIREVFGLLSWAIAAVIAYFFHGLAAPLVGMFVSSEFLKEAISFILVFLVSLIVLTAFTYSFSDAVKSSVVGGADKVLGFLFGSMRGFLLVAVFAFGVNKFIIKHADSAPTFLKASKLLPVADKMLASFIQAIPTKTLNTWKDKMENFVSDVSIKGAQKASEITEALPTSVEDINEE